MNLSKKNMSIAALVIVLFGAGVYFFAGSGGAVTTITAVPSSQTEATFLGLASELDTVTFNTSIFTDQRFLKLQDIHTSIIQEQVGRTDPFAPLAGVTSN